MDKRGAQPERRTGRQVKTLPDLKIWFISVCHAHKMC